MIEMAIRPETIRLSIGIEHILLISSKPGVRQAK
jgi:O-acetylhomoserine/O-acetylserine sulfhydrylase-like pyridoxal-dependent enzyme